MAILSSYRAAAPVSPTVALSVIESPFRIRHERRGDVAAREALLDASFGPSRLEKTCERLREGRLPAADLSFVAIDGEGLVGTLRFWHIQAGGRPALLLGPLAVDGTRRCGGIGGALMEYGLRRAAMLGHGAVLLVGDEPYYRRFGFEQTPTARLEMPGPVERERFLALELRPGALAGVAGDVVATGDAVATGDLVATGVLAAPTVMHRAA